MIEEKSSGGILFFGLHGSHVNYLAFICHCLYENIYVERTNDIYDGWRQMFGTINEKWPYWTVATGIGGTTTKNKTVIGINLDDKLYWAYQLITRGPMNKMGRTKHITMAEFEQTPFDFTVHSDNTSLMARNMRMASKIKDADKRKDKIVETLREYFFGYHGIAEGGAGIINGTPHYDYSVNISDFHNNEALYNKLTSIFWSLFNKAIDRELFEKFQTDFKSKLIYDPVSIRKEKYAINKAFDTGELTPESNTINPAFEKLFDKHSVSYAYEVNRVQRYKICDSPDCDKKGEYKTPKNRVRWDEYYVFCLEHMKEFTLKEAKKYAKN